MFRWLRLGDRRGNVAVIAALCAPVMMLMVGAAIDYAYAVNINQRLNEAADTAVLSAISPAIAQGAGSYALAYSSKRMKIVAANTFLTNTSALPISAPNPIITITPTINNNISNYTATLTYSTSVPTFFSALVGIPTIPISGHAQATTSPLTYIRYYILIDISQSMGIGATTADMQKLYMRIANNGQGTGGEPGCVFGCHVAESTQNASNEDYAHNNKNVGNYIKNGLYGVNDGGYITLRVDSANTAVQSIIQTAIADENSTSPNISIGLYTMSSYPSATITPIFPTPQTNPTADKWQATTNLSAYTNAAVDLGENTPGGLGDSNLPDQISSFAANLPAQGTGASASSPLNYVFLVTDGMTDIYDPTGACTSGHCTASLQPSQCSALKAKATVGVIYTTYLPLYNYNNSADGYEINYSELVYPNQYPNNSYPTDAIQKNLTACATSSNYFFPASYGPDIVAAMQSLFATSLQTVRLTQ